MDTLFGETCYILKQKTVGSLGYLTHTKSPYVTAIRSIWGCLKTLISIKWCFHALWVFFLLSFFQVLASHPHETIHIVCSLWDITLQPPASHLFFGEKLASAKLAASNMSHKQYIMYMYEHRYRFFSNYRFLEWELHIANGGSWHTKRIGAGLLYSPIWISLVPFTKCLHCEGGHAQLVKCSALSSAEINVEASGWLLCWCYLWDPMDSLFSDNPICLALSFWP